jgi:hypothetical protein
MGAGARACARTQRPLALRGRGAKRSRALHARRFPLAPPFLTRQYRPLGLGRWIARSERARASAIRARALD